METLFRDLRLTFRSLADRPGFTVAAVVSLAAAVAPVTLVLSLLSSAFLRALPVEDPESLIAVLGKGSEMPGYLPHSYPNFEDLRDRAREVADLAVAANSGFSLQGRDRTDFVVGHFVSADYFRLLGVEAHLGRTFAAEEGAAEGSGPVVVLSHAAWQRRFDADPGILGQTIALNNHPLTVIGVARRGFRGIDQTVASELWVPASQFPYVSHLGRFFRDREWRIFDVIGRLRPGMSQARAGETVGRIASELVAEHPDVNRGLGLEVVPLRRTVLGANNQASYERGAFFLLLLVGLLVATACANVANLLVARGAERERESALRLALGSGMGRALRLPLLEGLVLALGGGLLGLGLAVLSRGFFWRLRPDLGPRETNVSLGLDLTVLVVVLALAVAAGLIAALAPALRLRRPDLAAVLKEGGKSTTGGPRRLGLRDVLVGVQVALSLAALLAAGVLLESLGRVRAIEPGMDVERLATFAFSPAEQGRDEASGRELYRRVLEVARTVPGVEAASLATSLPFNAAGEYLQVRALESEEADEVIRARADVITPEHLEVVGVPLVAGRAFTADDRRDSYRVAIVNQTMAEGFWGGRDPIGKKLLIGDDPTPIEVIGVARNALYTNLTDAPQPYFYLPLEQRYPARGRLFVRTPGRPAAVLEAVRREVQKLDPSMALVNPRAVEVFYNNTFWATRLGAATSTTFAGVALALALAGIYGLIAYWVVQRRQEIGIRLALGAGKPSVVGWVLGRVLLIAGLGVILGLVLAFAGSGAAAGVLPEVGSIGAATVVAAVAILSLVCLLAGLLPAWRAANVAPAGALRSE
ncbi:MAG TPA: ADOP family duplicated permease [Thermoanaerobaculia bacterium]|nr:ADOP family duplicated permease [Thermoanaerobaculia bacterium]